MPGIPADIENEELKLEINNIAPTYKFILYIKEKWYKILYSLNLLKNI